MRSYAVGVEVALIVSISFVGTEIQYSLRTALVLGARKDGKCEGLATINLARGGLI